QPAQRIELPGRHLGERAPAKEFSRTPRPGPILDLHLALRLACAEGVVGGDGEAPLYRHAGLARPSLAPSPYRRRPDAGAPEPVEDEVEHRDVVAARDEQRSRRMVHLLALAQVH